MQAEHHSSSSHGAGIIEWLAQPWISVRNQAGLVQHTFTAVVWNTMQHNTAHQTLLQKLTESFPFPRESWHRKTCQELTKLFNSAYLHIIAISPLCKGSFSVKSKRAAQKRCNVHLKLKQASRGTIKQDAYFVVSGVSGDENTFLLTHTPLKMEHLTVELVSNLSFCWYCYMQFHFSSCIYRCNNCKNSTDQEKNSTATVYESHMRAEC